MHGAEFELHKVAVSVLPSPAESEPRTVTVVVGGGMSGQPYRLRDAVLSMVSHELRTPLLHIKGFVSTLLESDIEWDEETRLDFLHTIDREADRLTSMVSDLMEISRMGSGDLPLHLENAEPYLLAYAALDSASPFAHKHRVIIRVPEHLPKIRVDVLRVMGVLVNLIENATKYSAEGSKIIVDAEEKDGHILFSVTDEGIGIPEDSFGKIFSMFYRGDVGGKHSEGTGLGLAVCKSVLDAHKGEIWVESEVGKGSRFTFSIPLKRRRSPKLAPKVAPKAARSGVRAGSAGTRSSSSTSSTRARTRGAVNVVASGSRRQGSAKTAKRRKVPAQR